MYLHKVKGKTKTDFFGISSAIDEKRRIRIRVLQWYGCADPDPCQNVTDPQHWRED
jgi:hypothetical protein